MTALLTMATAWAQTPPPITLHVETAGTLQQTIAENRKFQITTLTLSGNLNGTDIRFIREMAGSDIAGKSTEGRLTSLNLAGANIVAGGDVYFGTQTTADNIISTSMFAHLRLRSIILPETATAIDRGAFSQSTQLSSIVIGSGLTSFEFQAFEGCINLREFAVSEQNQTFASADGVLFNKNRTVMILFPMGKSNTYVVPNNVRTIGQNAFAFAAGLTSVTIGGGVTSIGANAFSDCRNLTEVRVRTSAPPSLGAHAFSSQTLRSARLLVPRGAFQAYWVTTGWSEFNNIIEDGTAISQIETQDNNTELLAQQQEVFFSNTEDTYKEVIVQQQEELVAQRQEVTVPQQEVIVQQYEELIAQQQEVAVPQQEVIVQQYEDLIAQEQIPAQQQEEVRAIAVVVEEEVLEDTAELQETIRRREMLTDILNRRIQAKTTSEDITVIEEHLTDVFEQNRGLLPLPVKNGYIDRHFGTQPHPELATLVIDSKGVNIQTQRNADALAVFDGVVVQRFSFPGHNNAVIIRHGNYLTVYSNLTEVYVRDGDIVSAQQAIGRIFNNDNSTELFFQLYRERELLNPCLFLMACFIDD